MKIEIDQSEVVHILNAHNQDNPLLKLILQKVEHIVATQKEVADKLEALNTTLVSVGDKLDGAITEAGKIGTETQTLITAVANLTAIISAGGATSPEVDAALAKVDASADRLKASSDALSGKLQEVDQLVPDPATP